MHNIRTTLDHLVCQLVRLNEKTPTTKSAFPIRRSTPGPEDLEKMRCDQLGGLRDEHRQRIEDLQPYANPGSPRADQLLALGAFDNLDKHQLVHPCVAAIEAVAQSAATKAPPETYRLAPRAVLREGTEIMRLRDDFPDPSGLPALYTITVGFGDPPIDLAALLAIGEYVESIVGDFAPVFPGFVKGAEPSIDYRTFTG